MSPSSPSPTPAPAPPARLDFWAAVWLVVFCAIWGVNMVAIKVSNLGLAPVTASAFRSAAAALLLMGWMAFRGIPLLHRGSALAWGVLTGVGFALEFLFIYLGLAFTSASRGMTLLYTAPFFMTIGAHFLLPGDRLTTRKALGLAAAFAGTAAVLGEHALAFDPAMLKGDLFCLLGGFFWAAVTLMIKARLTGVISPVQCLHYQLTFSVPVLASAALFLEPRPLGDFTAVTAWSLAFQVLVVVLGSYLGFYMLVYRYSVSRLSAFLFLAPLLGVVAGAVFLGEPLPATLLAGLAGIAAGIWLVNR